MGNGPEPGLKMGGELPVGRVDEALAAVPALGRAAGGSVGCDFTSEANEDSHSGSSKRMTNVLPLPGAVRWGSMETVPPINSISC